MKNRNIKAGTRKKPVNINKEWSAFDDLLGGCQIINKEWEYVYLNDAVIRQARMTRDELLGKKYTDIWPGAEKTELFSRMKKCMDHKTPSVFTNQFFYPDGSSGWFELSIQPIPEGIFIHSIDITDKINKEELLRESELHFKTLADYGQALIWTSGKDMKCNYFNKPWLEFTGRKLEQELGDGWAEGVHPDDLEKCVGIYTESFKKRQKFSMEYRLRHNSGEYRWIIDVGTPRYNSKGEFIGYIGHCLDISHIKKVEELLIEGEKKYKYLFHHNPIPMWIYDLETLKFLEVNDAAVSHYGYSRDEFLSMTLKDIRPVEDIEAMIESVNKTTNQINYAGKWRHKKKNGEVFFTEIVSHLIEFSGRKAKLVLANDITERIKMERELVESELKYRTLIEIFHHALFILRDDKIIFLNKAALNLFGLEKEEHLIGKSIYDYFVPAYQNKLNERIKLMTESGKSVNLTDGKIINLEGREFDVELTAIPFVYEGQTAILLVLRDITERKKGEQKLAESENRFRKIYENGPLGMAFIGRDFRFKFANRKMCEITGYSEEELQNMTFLDITHPDDRKIGIEQTIKVMNGEIDFFKIEKRYIHKTGKTIWGALTVNSIFSSDRKFMYNVSILEDITEMKNSLDTASRLTERLNLAAKAAHLGIWDWDVKQNKITWDDKMYELFGLEKENFKNVYENWLKIVHPEERQNIDEEIKKALKGEKEYNTEYRILSPDNSVRWLKANGLVYWDDNGKPLRMVGINYDITERKEAEQKLMHFHNLMKYVIEHNNSGVAIFDRDMRYIYVSQRFLEEYGIKDPDVIGKSHYEIFPDLPERIREIHKRVLNGEVLSADEEAYEREDNRIDWVRWECRPWYEMGGSVGGLIIYSEVITSRKLAEQQRREALEKFEIIVNTSPQAIIVSDVNDILQVWNKAAERIFEWKSNEVIGKYNPIVPEDKKSELENIFSRLLKGESFLNFETERIRKNGERINVKFSSSPLRDNNGNIIGFLKIFEDITEQKKISDAIKQSEEHIKFALETSGIGAWDLDIETLTAVTSLLHDRIFGYSENLSEFTYERFLNHIHPDDKDYVIESFNDAFNRKKDCYVECRIHRVDGEMRWISSAGRYIQGKSGKPDRLTGIVMDITERKLAEEKVMKLNEELEMRVNERTAQLEEANKELEAFSYSVSHDLRAPLRAISGFSKILLDDYSSKLDKEGQELLEDIEMNSNKMSLLIDDLLELSRLGRKSLSISEINMNELFDSVFKELSDNAPENLEIKISKLHNARGDYTLLKQVVINLISNAIKFSSKKQRPEIKISSSIENGEYIYCVSDNGDGFNMKYANKLFEVFQRLHHEKDFPGTGVGLAIVNRVIKKHGGRVWAEGETGKGARFYFSLPKYL